MTTMTKPNTLKILGTVISVIAAGLAAVFPKYAREIVPISTFILGAIHVPQPGTVKAPS